MGVENGLPHLFLYYFNLVCEDWGILKRTFIHLPHPRTELFRETKENGIRNMTSRTFECRRKHREKGMGAGGVKFKSWILPLLAFTTVPMLTPRRLPRESPQVLILHQPRVVLAFDRADNIQAS